MDSSISFFFNIGQLFLGRGNLGGNKINSDPAFRPLHGVCEFLNAVHIYADEARQGVVRHVEAHHYCSHVGKDLRQCLIYDSARQDARLIGVEYMIPKHVYETLDPEEQKFWHSHEYEVSSGMLVMPKPQEATVDNWEKMELEAMKQVVGLYGKTWHFWQIDKGDELPLANASNVRNVGVPKLMGALVKDGQLDLDKELESRNKRYDVDHKEKAKRRADAGIEGPGVHPNADIWWKESGAV
ncbi:hypothetical protein F5884DRAFT_859296 [Xylogone sp. PMI_703]|nr:hypothetical protein F5884DRAFT_859296 [Xylogone sp. PMI_703]